MFGFIKNLVKKSDNNFFLELKEDVEEKIAEVKEEVKKEDKAPAQAKASKENKPVAKAEPAPTTASSNGKMTKKDGAAAKTSKIDAAKKAGAAKEAEAARPKDPSELAAAAVAKKTEVQTPKETNFATKYLMTPSSNGRRRPGPNMNSFLEMAGKVKPPTQK